MKRLALISIMMVFLVLINSLCFGQVVVVGTNLWANKTIVNGTTYTSTAQPIAYTNGSMTGIINCIPDSIRISWEAIAPGDSNDVKVYFTTSFSGNPVQSYTLIDSVKDDELSFVTLTRAQFTNADNITLRLIAASSGNGNSKLWIRFERWFKLP